MEVITLIFGTAASFTGIAALYYGFLVFTGYRKIRKSKELSTENEEELYPLVTYRDNLKKEIALLSDKEKVLRETKQLEKDRAAIQKAIDDMDTLKEAGERATRFMDRMQYGWSRNDFNNGEPKKQWNDMNLEERSRHINETTGRKPHRANPKAEKNRELLNWINGLLEKSTHKELSGVEMVIKNTPIAMRCKPEIDSTFLGKATSKKVYNVNRLLVADNYLWVETVDTSGKYYYYGNTATNKLYIPIAKIGGLNKNAYGFPAFNLLYNPKLNLWVYIKETKDELASVEDIALIREHEKKKEVEIKYRNFPKEKTFEYQFFANGEVVTSDSKTIRIRYYLKGRYSSFFITEPLFIKAPKKNRVGIKYNNLRKYKDKWYKEGWDKRKTYTSPLVNEAYNDLKKLYIQNYRLSKYKSKILYTKKPEKQQFKTYKIHSNNTFRANQEDLYKTKVIKSNSPPQFLERFLKNEYHKRQPRFYRDILNYALYDGDWSLNTKYGTVWTRTPLYLFNRSQIDFLLKGKTVPSMRAKEAIKTIIKYPKGYHYITQLGYNEGIFWVCIRETLSPTKEVWIPIELLLKLSKTDIHFTTERR